MKMTRQVKAIAWIAAAVVIAVSAYFIGGALKPGEEPYYIFDTEAPAFQEPSEIAATSPGGFTGFGETDGSNSRVVLSGRVVEMTETAVTLEGAEGQPTLLEFGDAPPVYRVDEGSRDLLVPGMAVSVLLDEAEETVVSVLVVSEP